MKNSFCKSILIYSMMIHLQLNAIWSPPVTLTPSGFQVEGPQVAVDLEGTAIAVFEFEPSGSTKAIQSSVKLANSSWQTTPDNVSAIRGDEEDPQIAIGPDGTATVVWYERDSTSIYSSSRPLNGNWGSSEFVGTAGNGGSPQVAIGPDGTATAVWVSESGGNYEILSSSKPVGGIWASPVRVFLNTAYSLADPQIAVGPDGTATAVWGYDGGGGNYPNFPENYTYVAKFFA